MNNRIIAALIISISLFQGAHASECKVPGAVLSFKQAKQVDYVYWNKEFPREIELLRGDARIKAVSEWHYALINEHALSALCDSRLENKGRFFECDGKKYIKYNLSGGAPYQKKHGHRFAIDKRGNEFPLELSVNQTIFKSEPFCWIDADDSIWEVKTHILPMRIGTANIPIVWIEQVSRNFRVVRPEF